jgi:predicted nucleic acid-binding protein
MPYLIDSDWVIPYLADAPWAQMLLGQLTAEGLAISIVTYLEVYEGVLSSPTPREAETKFQALLRGVLVIGISQAIARRCALLRKTLRDQGRRVQGRALDLPIAATALEQDLILVTRNREDFADIPGLQLFEQSDKR